MVTMSPALLSINAEASGVILLNFPFNGSDSIEPTMVYVSSYQGLSQ